MRLPICLSLFSLLFSLLPAPLPAADAPDVPQVIKTFRERQALEKEAAQKDKAKIEAHIQKVESLRATLTLPKDAEADAKLQQALQLDREALRKAEERLHLAEVSSFSPSPAPRSSPQIVRWVEFHGEGHILNPDGSKVNASNASRAPIEMGATIVTGSTGRITLVLPDDTDFTLGPNGNMTLDEFVYDPATNAGKVVARVTKGILRFITGKKAKKPEHLDLKVNFSGGSLGRRGTESEIKVAPDRAGYVKVFEGEVEITELRTGRVFLLKTGQMTLFDRNGTFSSPQPLTS